MKSLNNKDVRRGYVKFSLMMVVVISMPILMCCSLYWAVGSESKKIESRSSTFDKTFAMQVEIVDRVDSLYNYISLLNSDPRINDLVVQGVISSRKMSLMEDIESMNSKDVLLYKNLLNSINMFLTLKDSIRNITNEEQTVRDDLKRCVESDQQASRKLSLEGAQTKK